MNCPSCPAKVLALFICDDGVHRCYQCKARQPRATHPLAKPAPEPAKEAAPTLDTCKRRSAKLGRIEVLQMIEAELQGHINEIEARPNWRESGRSVATQLAYTQAIQIVRDHHVIMDGKPMRGGR